MSNAPHIIQQFYELVKEADRADIEEPGRSVEREFNAVLDYVLMHPDAREDFIKAFMDIIDEGILSPGLVEYCLHGLRWTELKQKIQASLHSEKSERSRYFLKSILEAFEDDWNMKDFYDRFS